MDPVAHTLVGAAIARALPARRTPLAMATGIAGANLPDLDVLSYVAGGVFPLAFRRGWTHGALAMLILPGVLAAVMLGWDRVVRRRRDPAAPPAVPRELVLLAAVAVLSHPLLDLLNVYGIRLLMPAADRWFYGDVLFIADPWLWTMLAIGLWMGSRADARARDAIVRPGRGAVRVALAVTAGYVALMSASAALARRDVRGSMPSAWTVDRLMVGPDPVTPFRKWVVIAEQDGYRVGEFDWLGTPRFSSEDLVFLPRGDGDPAVARARRLPEARWFLAWARFPFFRVEPGADGGTSRVHMIDARYALEASARFGALTVEVAVP